jgi:hypothetical protein
MHYFALLLSPSDAPERRADPAQQETAMTAYRDFHTRVASSIRGGDALTPAAGGVRIAGGPDAPMVTDGPFPESAEVAGGFYVFEADDLDAALELARQCPHASEGEIEVWPIVEYFPPARPVGAGSWLALLLEPPANAVAPGTPEWEAGAGAHQKFGAVAGDRVNGGAALHPPATATTVRVRDAQVVLTDGPFVEGAEVANGFYILDVADRDEAIKIASMIPASKVELRQLMGVSGL